MAYHWHFDMCTGAHAQLCPNLFPGGRPVHLRSLFLPRWQVPRDCRKGWVASAFPPFRAANWHLGISIYLPRTRYRYEVSPTNEPRICSEAPRIQTLLGCSPESINGEADLQRRRVIHSVIDGSVVLPEGRNLPRPGGSRHLCAYR